MAKWLILRPVPARRLAWDRCTIDDGVFFGVVMVAAPVSAHLLLNKNPHETFFVELTGVWAFGFYWLFKTYELKRSDIEGRAIKGELLMDTKML